MLSLAESWVMLIFENSYTSDTSLYTVGSEYMSDKLITIQFKKKYLDNLIS